MSEHDYEYQDLPVIDKLFAAIERDLARDDFHCWRCHGLPTDVIISKRGLMIARLHWSKYDSEGNTCDPRVGVRTYLNGMEKNQGAIGVDEFSFKRLREFINR